MYEKVITWRFEVEGTLLDITQVGVDGEYVCIEEVEKNGQEDCHMSGVLEVDENGVWGWAEGEEMFCMYASEGLADGIVAYLNQHGPPKEHTGNSEPNKK